MSVRSARWIFTAVWFGAALATTGGCGGWLVAFNECNADKGDYLGRTTVDLDVRKTTVRIGESPVGDLVVDSIYEAAMRACQGGTTRCPDAAIENAGAIRPTTACGERESIPIGAIHAADIDDMLPFQTNEIVIMDVTGEELWLMLERAVSILGQVGEAGAAGYFLLVKNISFEVDCARPAQTLSLRNDQILTRGERIDRTKVRIADAPLELTRTYRIAMNSFIGSANDGFLALAQRDAADAVQKDAAGEVITKPKDFITIDGERRSEAGATKDFVQAHEVVAPRIEGRIIIHDTCVPQQ